MVSDLESGIDRSQFILPQSPYFLIAITPTECALRVMQTGIEIESRGGSIAAQQRSESHIIDYAIIPALYDFHEEVLAGGFGTEAIDAAETFMPRQTTWTGLIACRSSDASESGNGPFSEFRPTQAGPPPVP